MNQFNKIMKLSDIRLNPDNPRKIKQAKMAKLIKSIKDFPEMMKIRPIVVDETGMILGGNMRYQALKKMGIKETEVTIAEGLTDAQKREFIIKDNSEFGEWDFDMLLGWDEPLEDWGLELDENEEIGNEYNNNNCEYPLIPIYDEKYEAIIIICRTETEIARIKTKFNMIMPKRSYKNTYLGDYNVIESRDIK